LRFEVRALEKFSVTNVKLQSTAATAKGKKKFCLGVNNFSCFLGYPHLSVYKLFITAARRTVSAAFSHIAYNISNEIIELYVKRNVEELFLD
jgi:hypothetical protein